MRTSLHHFYTKNFSSLVSRVGGKTNQIEPLRLGPSKFSFMKMWRAAASKFTTVNYYCEHDQTKKPGLAKNFDVKVNETIPSV